MQLTGYMFKNAEYRMSLTRSLKGYPRLPAPATLAVGNNTITLSVRECHLPMYTQLSLFSYSYAHSIYTKTYVYTEGHEGMGQGAGCDQ